MVLIPPQARPSGGTMLGNHEARIRALERQRGGGGERLVYGIIFNDGGPYLPGSGDWDSTWTPPNIIVTVAPAFTAEPTCFACAVDPLGSSPPDAYLPGPGAFTAQSGLLKVTVIDLSTLAITAWDIDGNNAIDDGFYFSFLAIERP